MVRLATARDADDINAILNHEEVLPFIGDGEPLDIRISPPSILTFYAPGRVIFFTPFEGGVWEFHTAFTPGWRGRHGLRMAKACATRMFEDFRAQTLVTFTPDDAPHARPPRTMGFRQDGRREQLIRGVGATRYTLSRETWRQLCQQEP